MKHAWLKVKSKIRICLDNLLYICMNYTTTLTQYKILFLQIYSFYIIGISEYNPCLCIFACCKKYVRIYKVLIFHSGWFNVDWLI